MLIAVSHKWYLNHPEIGENDCYLLRQVYWSYDRD